MLLALGIPPLIGILAVRRLHEAFQLFLKACVAGGAGDLAHLGRTRPRRGRGRRRGTKLIAAIGHAAVFSSLFEGKVDLPLLVNVKDLDPHELADLKMVMHVFNKGMRNFGNMNQAALAAGKRDESTETHDAGYLTLLNTADFYQSLSSPAGNGAPVYTICFREKRWDNYNRKL